MFTVDAMAEVHTALGERRLYLLRGHGPAPWKYGDQMQSKVRRGELLQDLERIAAVPAATGFDACGAQLGILFGEMGYTGKFSGSNVAEMLRWVRTRSPEDCVEVASPDHDQVPHGRLEHRRVYVIRSLVIDFKSWVGLISSLRIVPAV